MSKKADLSELFFSRTRDFLDIFLTRQELKSEHTVKAYRISLARFCRYVTEEKGISVLTFRFTDCTYDFVLEYIQHLRDTDHLSNSTLNQRLAAIKSYLKYVSDSDITLMQVYMSVCKVPLMKLPKLQRAVLERDELALLFNAPTHTRFGNRDRTILILLFDSAIRVSELTSITLGDVSLRSSESHIVIHGKGKKMRSVVLNDRCAAHVREYIKKFHKPDASSATPLFYTVIHGNMTSMSQRNIERILKKYSDAVRSEHPELPDSVYPHMLRRSRATGLYRDGVPIEMISAILGHLNSETTKIYAIPSVEQLRNALNNGVADDASTEKLWEGREDEIMRMFGLK